MGSLVVAVLVLHLAVALEAALVIVVAIVVAKQVPEALPLAFLVVNQIKEKVVAHQLMEARYEVKVHQTTLELIRIKEAAEEESAYLEVPLPHLVEVAVDL